MLFILCTGSKPKNTPVLPSDGTCSRVEPRFGAPGGGSHSDCQSWGRRVTFFSPDLCNKLSQNVVKLISLNCSRVATFTIARFHRPWDDLWDDFTTLGRFHFHNSSVKCALGRFGVISHSLVVLSFLVLFAAFYSTIKLRPHIAPAIVSHWATLRGRLGEPKCHPAAWLGMVRKGSTIQSAHLGLPQIGSSNIPTRPSLSESFRTFLSLSEQKLNFSNRPRLALKLFKSF